MKIQVTTAMRAYVPGYVFQQAAFTPVFKEVHGLSPAFQSTQLKELRSRPTRQAISIIGDVLPSPAAGRYLATWMAQLVNAMSPTTTPLYVYCDDAAPDDYTGVVHAPEMRVEAKPCALIISMGVSITPVQLERARDIMAKWQVPTFVQCSQHKPFDIAASLGVACHRAFYLSALRETSI